MYISIKGGHVLKNTIAIRILSLALFIFLMAKGKIMLWLGLFGISLFAALIFGRMYCGYICPMNTLMVPTEWVSKKLGIQTSNVPKWLNKGYFAWITLGLSVAIMIFSKLKMKINLPLLPFWLLLSVIVTLRYKPEVFHNLICPFGALQKTFGRFARFSKQVDRDACIGCKLCEKACPSLAINVGEDKKASVNTTLCHQCTDCQYVCPTSAILYKKREYDISNSANLKYTKL